MLDLTSKTLCDYYGNNPDEYYIKFVHHNIDILEETAEEYKRIKEDLEKIYNFDPKAFLLYFSDTENLSKIINNIGIEYPGKTYLRIRSADEYYKLKKLNISKSVKIIIDIKDLEKLNIIDYDLVIQVDKICELSISDINQLLQTYRIKEILLGQRPYISKDYDYLYDIMAKMYNVDSTKKLGLEKLNKITNDLYTVDEYIKILNKFQKILDGLKIKGTIDGIYKIFDYIAKNVSYDDNGVIETKIANQNLIGPVLNNICVCEGYAKYLQQLLSLINVNSIIVYGGGAKAEGGHVWNQVLVQGNWYNADVTAASYAIRHNEKVNTCLVKDSNLKYKTNTSISHDCNEDYKDNYRD